MPILQYSDVRCSIINLHVLRIWNNLDSKLNYLKCFSYLIKIHLVVLFPQQIWIHWPQKEDAIFPRDPTDVHISSSCPELITMTDLLSIKRLSEFWMLIKILWILSSVASNEKDVLCRNREDFGIYRKGGCRKRKDAYACKEKKDGKNLDLNHNMPLRWYICDTLFFIVWKNYVVCTTYHIVRTK